MVTTTHTSSGTNVKKHFKHTGVYLLTHSLTQTTLCQCYRHIQSIYELKTNLINQQVKSNKHSYPINNFSTLSPPMKHKYNSENIPPCNKKYILNIFSKEDSSSQNLVTPNKFDIVSGKNLKRYYTTHHRAYYYQHMIKYIARILHPYSGNKKLNSFEEFRI